MGRQGRRLSIWLLCLTSLFSFCIYYGRVLVALAAAEIWLWSYHQLLNAWRALETHTLFQLLVIVVGLLKLWNFSLLYSQVCVICYLLWFHRAKFWPYVILSSNGVWGFSWAYPTLEVWYRIFNRIHLIFTYDGVTLVHNDLLDLQGLNLLKLLLTCSDFTIPTIMVHII